MTSNRPKVVVVGGGFAGMACARALANSSAEVTLVDRRNFHLFQPLLYQVATGGLSPANIAAPLRSIFRRQRNVRVLLDEVIGFNVQSQQVQLAQKGDLPYDYLVVAGGSTHHYFGNDAEWEPRAPGLKTIEDATRIRASILGAFEAAERANDLAERAANLTFVVVGGGPTGVEMAGSICELARYTLRNDFREINPASARVLLVENSKAVLDKYDPVLSQKAKDALCEIGVEVWNEARLEAVHASGVDIRRNGECIHVATKNVIWAAGVKASPLAAMLANAVGDQQLIDRGGRITVNEFCELPKVSNVFAAGDMASFATPDGKSLPGVAPVAMQQGHYIGARIGQKIDGNPQTRGFQYWDKGNMATIGRSHAVMEAGKWKLSGRIAWLAWLFIHILYLARFENRILVLFQWFWNYVTRNRSARLITDTRKAQRTGPLLMAIAAVTLGGESYAQSNAAPAIEIFDTRVISWKPPLYHGWPTLARRKDGELLLAFSGGRESHVCPFGRLEWMRSKDDGAHWGWPQVLLDSPIDDRDAGVVETAHGSILVTQFTSLAYEPILKRAESAPVGKPGGFANEQLIAEWRAARDRLTPDERKGELGCYLIRSTDGGVTWSARQRVPVNSPHGPVVTRAGRLLYAGKAIWKDDKVGICESKDDGLTWDWIAEFTARPGDSVQKYHELHLVEASDGTLVCHIRNENERSDGETLQSESTDGGHTWSVPHSIGVWGIPSHLLALRDGRLLMSYGYRRPPYGNQARVSSDSGKTWSEPITLSADGVSGDLGYPSTVECENGTLVTVWYEVLADSPLAQLRQTRWRFLPPSPPR